MEPAGSEGGGIYQEDPELASGSQRVSYRNRDQNMMDQETNLTVAIDDFMRSPASAARMKPIANSNDSQVSHANNAN